MSRISVAYDVSDAAFARVCAIANLVEVHEVNFNGAALAVERDEFTGVEYRDEVVGSRLLQLVYKAIDDRLDISFANSGRDMIVGLVDESVRFQPARQGREHFARFGASVAEAVEG